MANFKRKKPNPKQDEYLGWTAEGKIHHDLRQPQVHDHTVINRIDNDIHQRRVKHV